jgi:peroxiredoxin
LTEPSPYAAIAQVFDTVRGMDAPLNLRLWLLAEAVKEGTPQFAEAVEALIARLAGAGLGRRAPAVGEPLPPFLLPDETGRLTGLAEILDAGPAVVSFHRGHWCPYCRLSASAFARVQDVIGPRHMVAITPETGRRNVQFAEETRIAYRVLTDPDNGYALSLNLAFWIDDSFADLMRAVGQDLANYQAGAAWVLPIPATFIVDSRGVIAARHVDPDYRRRMEIDDLVAAFEEAS